MVKLVSDPLGVGWNLFGTARMDFPPIILGASAIWHTQVGLILAGHIASVFLAHIEALRLFRDTRRALLSQLPMLALMVVLTAGGLWVLSMPIGGG
ncbi:hypothetical protein A9975_13890 [Cupriavidus sp. UME77]|nr:hypothetical protein [Cupriavidus sp. UME77]